MSDFTVVSDDVLEPGDPIRSVDILAIKNNTLFLFDSVISLPIIDQQRFDVSGTWTKPNISTPEAATLVAVLVGGGGAGGRCNFEQGVNEVSGAGGGGSGGVAIAVLPFQDTNTVSVVIGAGATGASTTGPSQSEVGNAGGVSSLPFTSGTLTSNGGGGGGRPSDLSFTAIRNAGSGGVGGTVSATGSWSQVINVSKDGQKAGTAETGAGFSTIVTVAFPVPVFSGGGAFAVTSGTQHSVNSAGGPAFALAPLNNEPLMGAGGTGSNTTATNGTTYGAGGGGAAASSGTVTSGSGANGGAIIFVVRGIISEGLFESKYLQIL